MGVWTLLAATALLGGSLSSGLPAGATVGVANSTVVASPTSVVADGSSQSTVTVTLSGGATSDVVSLSVVGASTTASINGSGTSASVTATSGVATFTVTDSAPESVTLQANDVTQATAITQEPVVDFFDPTVTFDANGGSGTMANQVSTTPSSLSANLFTRSGYSFAGWNTAADGSGTSYLDGASFPFAGNATLYAQWSAVSEATGFPVSHQTSSAVTSLAVTTQKAGDLLVLMSQIHSQSITISSVSATGTGTWHQAASYVDSVNHVITEEIWWTTVTSPGATTIDVTYSAAVTGLSQELVADSFTAPGESTWALGSGAGNAGSSTGTISLPSLSATSLANQLYWGYSQSTGGASAGSTPGFHYSATPAGNLVVANLALDPSLTYAPTASETPTTSNFTAIASTFSVTVVPTYTVTFDANGGSGTMGAESSTGPTALTANTFIRAGYAFTGWNTAADGSGTSYLDGASFPFAGNATLYAQWSAVSEATGFPVAAESQGLSSLDVTTQKAGDLLVLMSQIHSQSITISSVSATGTGTWHQATSYVDSVNHVITEEIWWTTVTSPGATTIQVTYSGSVASITPELVADSYSAPDEGAWSAVAGAGNAGSSTGTIQFPSLTSTVSANQLYWGYAESTGTAGSGATSGFTYDSVPLGNVVVLNGALDSSTTYAPTTTQSPSTSNFTAIGAIFSVQIVPTFTVSFDANGGSGSMSAQTGSAPTALEANAFTRAGYAFAGWNTAADGSGTPYADGGTYPFAASTTLYAQWTFTGPSGPNILDPGSSLLAGDLLTSPDGQFTLVMQGDGNLVEYHGATPVWATNTAGDSGAYAVMQGDGNFVLYASGGTALWAANTAGVSGAVLELGAQGMLTVLGADGQIEWGALGTVATGASLSAGQSISSVGGQFTLVMQGDGNLVEYTGSTPVWATNTAGDAGAYAVMQSDGNLVLYSSSGTALWASNTAGVPGAALTLSWTGIAAVSDPAGRVLWGDLGTLAAGQTLSAGQSISSVGGQFALVMQGDGNLVEYSGSTPDWATNTAGDAGAYAVMQSDGNLVLYSSSGTALWASGTAGLPDGWASLTSDGVLAVRDSSGGPVWAAKGYLTAGSTLSAGQSITSVDGLHQLVMQSDGNLVLYSSGTAVWATNTAGDAGAYAVMQSDGNFVLYDASGTALWASGTSGSPGAYVRLLNVGVVEVVADGSTLWQDAVVP